MVITSRAEVAEWQTRQTQNLLFERVCRFKSGLRHLEASEQLFRGFFVESINDPFGWSKPLQNQDPCPRVENLRSCGWNWNLSYFVEVSQLTNHSRLSLRESAFFRSEDALSRSERRLFRERRL